MTNDVCDKVCTKFWYSLYKLHPLTVQEHIIRVNNRLGIFTDINTYIRKLKAIRNGRLMSVFNKVNLK